MINKGRYFILTNYIQACDYSYVLSQIKESIEKKKNLLISPIASKTLVQAWYDKKLKTVLDQFDLLLPDSQWVKRAIHFLYGVRIKERVYGPDLMLKLCEISAKNGYSVGFYGTKIETLRHLKEKLKRKYPKLKITFLQPSLFRKVTEEEMNFLVDSIYKKKIVVLFVGLGSPLQEEFSFNLNVVIRKKTKNKYSFICIPVGAAFDFLSGAKKQAPRWMQAAGFEWFFRFIQEPGRLFRRYWIHGSIFLVLIIFQKISLLNFSDIKPFKK